MAGEKKGKCCVTHTPLAHFSLVLLPRKKKYKKMQREWENYETFFFFFFFFQVGPGMELDLER